MRHHQQLVWCIQMGRFSGSSSEVHAPRQLIATPWYSSRLKLNRTLPWVAFANVGYLVVSGNSAIPANGISDRT